MAYLYVVPLNVAYPDVFCAGAAPPPITGYTVALRARLVDENGNPLQGKEIIFEKSTDGVTYTEIARRITDENGEAFAGDAPTQTTYYRARFEGDDQYEPAVAEAVYTP